jgi:hypothetical protein
VSSVPLDVPLTAAEIARSKPVEKPSTFVEGAVLAPAMSSVLPSTGVFPPSAGPSEPVPEPSNLVVASDVMTDDSQSLDRACVSMESTPVTPSKAANRKRVAWIVGACASVLALAGATAFTIGGRAHMRAAATAHVAEPAAEVVQAAALPEAEPASTIELDDDAPLPPAPSVMTEAASGSETSSPKVPIDPKKRFGKFTIKAEAKHKTVWFDGKRMLGFGQRSFLVFCGMHTVAVSDKMDAKDIEVPCNGEFVVSK